MLLTVNPYKLRILLLALQVEAKLSEIYMANNYQLKVFVHKTIKIINHIIKTNFLRILFIFRQLGKHLSVLSYYLLSN